MIDGIDEFLNDVTVLPPGEWDPKVREIKIVVASFQFLNAALRCEKDNVNNVCIVMCCTDRVNIL